MKNEVVEVLDDNYNKKNSKVGLIILFIVVIIITSVCTILIINLTKEKVYKVDMLSNLVGESEELKYDNKIYTDNPTCNPKYDENNKRIMYCEKTMFTKLSNQFILKYIYQQIDGTQYDELRRYYSENSEEYELIYKAEKNTTIESVGMLSNDDKRYFIIEEVNGKGRYLKIINEKGEVIKDLTKVTSENIYTSYEILFEKNKDKINTYITYFNCDKNDSILTQSVYNINSNKDAQILKIDNITCKEIN